MFVEFDNLISKFSKQNINTENDKKLNKPNKSILLDTSTIDNETINTQIKKQLSKSERMMRSEFTNNFEEIDSKINTTRKNIDNKLLDFEEIINEKVKILDQKILESLSEKS